MTNKTDSKTIDPQNNRRPAFRHLETILSRLTDKEKVSYAVQGIIQDINKALDSHYSDQYQCDGNCDQCSGEAASDELYNKVSSIIVSSKKKYNLSDAEYLDTYYILLHQRL